MANEETVKITRKMVESLDHHACAKLRAMVNEVHKANEETRKVEQAQLKEKLQSLKAYRRRTPKDGTEGKPGRKKRSADTTDTAAQ